MTAATTSFMCCAPGAARAWGLLTTTGRQQWLGSPDATIQAAIQSNVE